MIPLNLAVPVSPPFEKRTNFEPLAG